METVCLVDYIVYRTSLQAIIKPNVYQHFIPVSWKIHFETMETLVSSWYNVQSLPKDYVFPPEKRPGKVIVPPCKTLPVVDLGKAEGQSRAEIIQQILQASQEFGFFQVTNHGVANTLMNDTISVYKEFFEMPAEDKASLYSTDPYQSCRLYTSSINYAEEQVHYWRDNLKHTCHPLEESMQLWPEKPTRYREVVGKYSIEVRKLSMRILGLICEGLGLELGYLEDEKLTKIQNMSINHYPPCPDPSLTLGIPKHCDPNLITILLQGDVCGLQVFKDGQWIGVDPLPNAFVVNIGYQLQIISNGKLRSVEHRAVTNSSEARTTIVTFITPAFDSIMEPAKALVNDGSPPIYRAIQYKEFLSTYVANIDDTEKVLEFCKLQA